MMATGNDKIPPVVEALSGSVGASIANVIVYPLDLVAARIQTKAPLRRSKHQDPKTGAHQKHDDYADTLTALRTIYRTNNHSLGAFYQGIASDTLSTALSQFLYFYIFAALMRLFNKHVDKAINNADNGKNINGAIAAAGKAAAKISAAKELLIGSIAGILSRGVTTPLSTITVRKQTAAKSSPKPEAKTASTENGGNDNEEDDDEDEDYAPDSSIDIARDIYQEHGLAGFWRGYGSACALTINPALTFFLIAVFKGALIPRRFRDKPTQVQTFFMSAFASAIASAACYPLILTKTRLQWKSPNGKLLYRNMTDVLARTIKRSGVRGLYVGLQTQIIKGFIAQGVTMVVKQRAELLIVYLYRILYRLRHQRIQ